MNCIEKFQDISADHDSSYFVCKKTSGCSEYYLRITSFNIRCKDAFVQLVTFLFSFGKVHEKEMWKEF